MVRQIHLSEVIPECVIDCINVIQNTNDYHTKERYIVIVDDYLVASIQSHAENMFNIVEIQKRDAYVGFFDDVYIEDYMEQADILFWLACIKDFVNKIMNESEGTENGRKEIN